MAAIAALVLLTWSRSLWVPGAGGFVTLFLLLVGWFVYTTPAIGLLPPERVAEGASGSIPTPDVSGLPPETSAMVRRGQYLFSVASCAFCHANDGSGGFKLNGAFSSGSGFGTIFIPNISSDRRCGDRRLERRGDRSCDPKRRLA